MRSLSKNILSNAQPTEPEIGLRGLVAVRCRSTAFNALVRSLFKSRIKRIMASLSRNHSPERKLERLLADDLREGSFRNRNSQVTDIVREYSVTEISKLRQIGMR